jgi:hypothetical protein
LTAGAIKKEVAKIEAVIKEKAAVQPDLDACNTGDLWPRNIAKIAKKTLYLDGELLRGFRHSRRIHYSRFVTSISEPQKMGADWCRGRL